MDERDVRLVQTCYPQIYLACHTRHTRAASSATGLSARDSSLLAHLDETRAIGASALARHMGVSGPTISAVIKRLVALGYIDQERDPADARRRRLRLAEKGADAMRDSSVLEAGRVRDLLSRMTPESRGKALEGLVLLAQASRELMKVKKRHA